MIHDNLLIDNYACESESESDAVEYIMVFLTSLDRTS